MPISTVTNRVEYAGNGTSAVFAWPYRVNSPTHLGVFIFNSSFSSPSVITPQVLNTDFTFSGTANSQGIYESGGNIIFNSSPNALSTIIIFRSSVVTNEFRVLQNGAIPATSLNNEIDYLTMIQQRAQDLATRSTRLQDGWPGTFDTTLPSNIKEAAGKRLIVNSTATGWTFDETIGNFTPNTLVVARNNSTVTSFGGTIDGPVLLSRGSSGPEWGAVNLASSQNVVGVLPVANGGTGTQAFTPFSLIYMSSATQMGEIPAVAPAAPVGSILTSNGSSAPSFQAFSANNVNSGAVQVQYGGTGTNSIFAPGSVVFAAGSGGIYAESTAINFNSSSQTLLIGSGFASGKFQAVGMAAAPARTDANGVIVSGSTSLTADVSGTLPVTSGGTGTNVNYTQYGVIYASSATQFATVPAAQSGYALYSNGSSAPSFQPVSVTNTIVTVMANTTVAVGQNTILCPHGSSVTLYLYAATGNDGRSVMIKKTGLDVYGQITVRVQNGESLEGGTRFDSSFIIGRQFEGVEWTSDGSKWIKTRHLQEKGLVAQWRIAAQSSLTWTNTGTVLGEFNSSNIMPLWTILNNYGPGVALNVNYERPQVTINWLPAGRYQVLVHGLAGPSGSLVTSTLAINDGSSTSPTTGSYGNTVTGVTSGIFNYNTDGNRTFKLYGGTTSGTLTLYASIGNATLTFELYRI